MFFYSCSVIVFGDRVFFTWFMHLRMFCLECLFDVVKWGVQRVWSFVKPSCNTRDVWNGFGASWMLLCDITGALSCACFALVECDFIEKILLKVGDCECVYASAVSLVAEFSIGDHAV